MAKITYIEHDGKAHVVEVETGWSVMKGAVYNGIPGIVAECGGACVCATCHVYVDDTERNKLKPMDVTEQETIEFALDVRENSRLACQVTVQPELDGLVVRMPETQIS
jgi:2Fe-2S ferredoxin